MARLPRIVLPDQPLHIMHRGNNRQDIFESEEDIARIKDDLLVSLEKSACSLHAYVIMTNHLHLLLTPKDKSALSNSCSQWRIVMCVITMHSTTAQALFGRDDINLVW